MSELNPIPTSLKRKNSRRLKSTGQRKVDKDIRLMVQSSNPSIRPIAKRISARRNKGILGRPNTLSRKLHKLNKLKDKLDKN